MKKVNAISKKASLVVISFMALDESSTEIYNHIKWDTFQNGVLLDMEDLKLDQNTQKDCSKRGHY